MNIDIMNNNRLNEDEVIEFSLLKHVSRISRYIFIFLLFLSFYGAAYSTGFFVNLVGDVANLLFIGFSFFLLFLERKIDKIIRRRIIGKVILSSEKMKIIYKNKEVKEYRLSEINMLWINYGINTLTNLERRHDEYKFENFETIYLRLIDENEKVKTFHINNFTNIPEKGVVTNYLEQLRKTKHFFRIHFEMTSRFKIKDYRRIKERHTLMKSSLQRRANKKR